MICLWAVPYGLGAGAVDAALNNFVALHFKSKHMNWLHSFWGVGASLGPFIMGFSLSRELGWNMGYLFIFIIQVALTMVLFVSLPLWKKVSEEHGDVTTESYKLLDLIKLKGSKPALLTFFAYCGLEHGAGLWGATFAVIALDFDPKFAAMMVSIYYLGITIGRMVSGFISMKLNNQSMVRLGQVIILVGSFILMFGKSEVLVASGFILIGLGCAPIFPSLLHQTPVNFGKEKSQAMIGVQMASAYVGSSLIPPLFGYLLQSMSIYLFPYIIFVLAITMIISAEQLNRRRNEKLY
jgi:fucose permease